MTGKIAALLLVAVSAARAADEPPARDWPGFLASSLPAEANVENDFRARPDAARIRATMERLSAHPHHVGSPGDRANREWILSELRGAGWDARLERFDVLFPTPIERRVEMLEPEHFTAKLEEPAVPEDPTSGQKSEQLPTYNVYSIDGDVTAPLVFVNYGVPDDYEELDGLGISVEGAIVIARYMGSWRGIKPKVAAEHGAVGCLIYSDPRDDGFFEGDTFPKGPFRPRDGVQRGSVVDMPLYPGDPQTPGWGSVPGAKRLPLSEVSTLTKIPVLPLSYADAEPLLKNLSGPMAPKEWRGALPFPYHVGPGPAKVRLTARFRWDVVPIEDVVATIAGSTLPDEWIVRGNHQDAWVNGAEDPLSGQSAMLEEARALGEMHRRGWRPKRTIVYCAWDGEEAGLLGSTEWAETHAEEVSRKVAAYVNSDSSGRGFFTPGASATLRRLLDSVARDLVDPESGVTVARRALLHEKPKPPREGEEPDREIVVAPLGSGSDYSAFLDHFGVACANLGFGGEDSGGVYHSIYDDFYWFTHFSDTTFAYEKLLAQAGGLTVLRLADADVLPFDYTDLARAVSGFVAEVEELARDKRSKAETIARRAEEGDDRALLDPKHPRTPPKVEPIPPRPNFAPLEDARDRLTAAARRFEEAWRRARLARALDGAAIDARLIAVDRASAPPEGLPGRPWYRNLLYAPGFYTGYGVKTLPAVREPIEQGQSEAVSRGIARTAAVIEAIASAVDNAARSLP